MQRLSIRWQLPLSYAAIALLATMALGVVLLTILNDFYAEQERHYLERNARTVARFIGQTWTGAESSSAMTDRLRILAFWSQTQIVISDYNGKVLADSGKPNEDRLNITVNEAPARVELSNGWIFNGINRQTLIYTIQHGEVIPEGDAAFISVAPGANGFEFIAEEPSPRQGQSLSDEKVTIPLYDKTGTQIGSATISGGPAVGADILSTVQRGWLISSLVAVALAVVAGWFASRWITDPLRLLTLTTTRMASGNLSARSGIHRRDELGHLADSFNTMADRIESTVTALRLFVADAAHELHTPLTALRTHIELTAERHPEIDQRPTLAQVKRLETLSNDLLDLSRLEAGSDQQPHTLLDLSRLTREACTVFASRAEQADIDFVLRVPTKPVTILGNPGQLERMLCNLLDNAVKFTPTGGGVTVELVVNDQDIQIIVEDTGIGIPLDDLPTLFSRFRRGRNTARYPGSGLGLAIVKAVVDAHHGHIRVEPLEQGTRLITVMNRT